MNWWGGGWLSWWGGGWFIRPVFIIPPLSSPPPCRLGFWIPGVALKWQCKTSTHLGWIHNGNSNCYIAKSVKKSKAMVITSVAEGKEAVPGLGRLAEAAEPAGIPCQGGPASALFAADSPWAGVSAAPSSWTAVSSCAGRGEGLCTGSAPDLLKKSWLQLSWKVSNAWWIACYV